VPDVHAARAIPPGGWGGSWRIGARGEEGGLIFNPGRVHAFELSTGRAYAFYPTANGDRCTAALCLDINPVDLIRNQRGNSFLPEQYVNDRPYTANSVLVSAIVKAFGTAMSGRCKEKPELADTPIPLEISLSSLRVDGDVELVEKLFAPLGYAVVVERLPLDEKFTSWGLSPYVNLTLSQTITLQQALRHLYVLVPVLDNDKHYYIAQQDIDVLMAKGAGWLDEHPMRDFITRRFFKNIKSLANQALLRLLGEEAYAERSATSNTHVRLHQLRLDQAYQRLKHSGATSVIDLGCGEGKLMRLLIKDGQFKKIAGMDVAFSELQRAKENLHLDEASPMMRERIQLFQGALTYTDERLKGYDAAALVEVIEHLDPERLSALERVVFGYARPKTVVLSTPNAEYNAVYDTLSADAFRHRDHRFEWTRAEFNQWCDHVCASYGYTVATSGIGESEADFGTPSQMAVFTSKS